MLSLPYELTPEVEELIRFLVVSPSETTEFFGRYWQGEEQQWKSALNYRLHKVKCHNVSKESFLQEFADNRKGSLERLFQHPVHDDQLDILDKRIQSGRITPERLYERFQQRPERQLLSLIL